MAIVFVDSCDKYLATADLATRYDVNDTPGNITINTTGGRYSEGGILFADAGTADSSSYMTHTFIDTNDETENNTVCVAFAFKSDTATNPASQNPTLFVLYNSLSGDPSGFLSGILSEDTMFVEITSGGVIRMSTYGRDSFGTSWDASTDICDGNWHWLEFRMKADNTTGIAQCYVDGGIEINQTNIDTIKATGNSYALSRIKLGTSSQWGSSWRIDDIIIWDDTTGSTGDLDADTNFPLGDSRIETLHPNGAGTNADFTPLSGANYTNVDETVPDDDTSYIESSTIGHTDTYEYENMTNTPASITAVVIGVQGKDSVTTGVETRGVALSSAVEGVSPTRGWQSDWRMKFFSIAQDPNTSTAWTKAGVDAAEFGVEVQ